MSAATKRLTGLGRRRRIYKSTRHSESAAQIQDGEAAAEPHVSGGYLGPGVRFFHDGDRLPPRFTNLKDGPIVIRAQPFDGSYLSLVAELDPQAATQIAPGVHLAVDLDIEASIATPAYLRAHFSNEEGREVLHDLIVVANGARQIRFNLDGLRVPLDLVTTVWVDAVFSDPTGIELSLKRFSLSVDEQ